MDGKRENQLLKERAGGSKVCREEKRERVFFLVEREREREINLLELRAVSREKIETRNERNKKKKGNYLQNN
jgi:hypothetical protein